MRVYSYQIQGVVRKTGVEGADFRDAFVVDETPQAAIEEAKRQLAIDEEAPGIAVEWLVRYANERTPDEGADWLAFHAQQKPMALHEHKHASA